MAEQAAAVGGYEYEFLDTSHAADYECMICHYVARDPQQAQCCGATYCSSCVRHSLSGCPNCRAPSLILIQDKAQRQRVNKLKVKCSHCDWTGEVADAQTHLTLQHPQLVETPHARVSATPHFADTTAHAHSHGSDFHKLSGASMDDEDFDDEPIGDERESLIELKQFAATNEDTRDDSPEPASRKNCLENYCRSTIYTTKKTKW